MVAAAALELREATGGSAPRGFCLRDAGLCYRIWRSSAEIVRVDGHVIELVGAITGTGLTSDGEENEDGSGFSLLALNAPKGPFRAVPLSQHMVEESTGLRVLAQKRSGVENPGSWIVLTNPFVFDNETWMKEWSEASAGRGLAWAAWPAAPRRVMASPYFIIGREIDAAAVSVRGFEVLPLVKPGPPSRLASP